MNDRIRSVAVVGMLLLAALVVGTTYWQAWAEGDLAAKQDNSIQLVAQFKIDRGAILAANGTVLATNTSRQVDGQTFYLRRYPTGPLAADVVGYSTQGHSQAGLERSLNDYLTASNANLHTVLTKTLDRLTGKTIKGNSVVLTLRPRAQFIAQKALDASCGAAVALQVETGRVLVMASSPTYNPNLVERDFGAASRAKANCASPAPLLNRATSGLYAPGSTFKLVTAAAALDTGRFTPDSPFYDPGYCVEYGKPVYNFGLEQGGPERFGNVTLAQGLEHSINSVYCNIGKALGARTILDYAKRFGFYSTPGLELPLDEQQASGLYDHHRLFFPKHDYQVDPGRLAFGQERLGVTPLQMAMVAATIANGGVPMKPYLVDRILTPAGGVLERTKPKRLGRAIKPETARELTTMMEAVVTSGTGTNAQIPGVPVAGKTGTAETGTPTNTAWFVCFAPADHPQVAVAVTLENQTGTGGQTAAPIAKTLLEALLGRTSS
ncbi:MAG TPA: penicillin-binding protein 2 [Gaiellaceae bacterium]|nr:penicillin-binding protein 2 [Gaiellaceae bacterium]